MAVLEVSVNTYGFATFIAKGNGPSVDTLIGYHNPADRAAWQHTHLERSRFADTRSTGPK